MLLANGFLYVVNGGKSTSNILCYAPSSTPYQYTYNSVFTPSLTAVSHPFDCTFQSVDTPSQQIWYVPNQDSNVVTVLTSSSPYSSSQPSNTSAYLTALLTALQNANSSLADAGFLDATFVPTAIVGAEIPAQTPVDPLWGGLTPDFSSADDATKKQKQKVQNSVRGVVCYNSVLYVADEGGSAVRMFDPGTGVPLGFTTVDKAPVHLIVRNGVLYVTSGNTVLYGNCVSAPATLPPLPTPNQFAGVPPPPYPAPPSGYTNSVTLKLTDLGLNLPSGFGPSGVTFDSSGNLYVAGRLSQQIYGYSPTGKTPPFVPFSNNPIFPSLPDQPEFLLWIADQ
jgi:hypothetical protein